MEWTGVGWSGHVCAGGWRKGYDLAKLSQRESPPGLTSFHSMFWYSSLARESQCWLSDCGSGLIMKLENKTLSK